MDFRERVAHAVVREAREETGLRLVRPEFLGLYDDPERDRRFGRNNVSVVYTARARGRLRLPPDGEVAAIRGCTREEIEDGRFRPTREDMILVAKFRTLRSGKTTVTIDPNGRRKHQRGKLTLAFDHGQILADYFARSD